MALSNPASAVGAVLSDVTITWSVLMQPLSVFVTVKVYVPPDVAVGWALVVELNPVEGLQEYDRFATADVPIVVPVVIQFMALSNPASAVGAVLSDVTIT